MTSHARPVLKNLKRGNPDLSLSPLIPFNNLKSQYENLKESIQRNIQKVLQHGHFIMGPEVGELEQMLARFVGAKSCITCSSGTDALLLSLMAMGIGPGDVIVTTPFTFIATAGVIRLTGATPLFADVDRKTFNLDIQSLRHTVDLHKKSSPRLKGIITVNLFGLPCQYDEIIPLAKEEGLFVLEDAAQSLGASSHGRKSGTLGDLSAVSFFPAKPLGCYGDGGAVFTDDDRLAESIRSMRIHGQGKNKYDNVRLGLNGRLDTLQAAILLAKLESFSEELSKRNEIAARYSKALASVVQVPYVPEGCQSAWAQYSLLTHQRDALKEHLEKAGIPTAIYYPTPLHLQGVFKDLGYQPGDFPVSEELSRKILSLPFSPYLTEKEQTFVISKILSFFHEYPH